MKPSALEDGNLASSTGSFDHSPDSTVRDCHQLSGSDESRPIRRRMGRGRLGFIDSPVQYTKTAETAPESSVSTDQALTQISRSSANSDRGQAILNGHEQASGLLDHVLASLPVLHRERLQRILPVVEVTDSLRRTAAKAGLYAPQVER